MRAKASAKKNPAAAVARVPWAVVHVRALPDYRLHVRFADGTAGEVDVRPLIHADTPGVFGALRDPAAFEQVSVDTGVVTWPGGVDLAPDAMYDDIKATGRRIAGR